MKTITVALGSRSYPVHIRAGLLTSAGGLLAGFTEGQRIVIVTDENVKIHLPALAGSLQHAGITFDSLILPPGEASKTWGTLQTLCDSLLALGVERADTVIALGGGVIGDLVGFACSILKRGCVFVQVPTTLLAQVDSSVGGKTAINTKAGKNLIGTFYQPHMVLIDPDVLDTLPERHVRAGYAEVVKYGLIDDAAFFEWCERNGPALVAGDRDKRLYAIAHSIAAKARIVAADEEERTGQRALLNLGHTFGHALEAATGFSDRLIHGEAVAAGCTLAARFSAERGKCNPSTAERVAAHFRSVGLPDGLSASGVAAGGEQLVAHMRHDKKMSGGHLPFLLLHDIGQAYLDRDVDLGAVAAFLDERVR